MAVDWCPENDGAYRAEMAALRRDSVDQQLIRARAEIERLRGALVEIAHTFTERADGTMKSCSASFYQEVARAALAQKGDSP